MNMLNDGIKNKVLISGYMRTGNTWVGLFLANYFNILNFNATESLVKIDIIRIFEHNIKKEIEENTPLNFTYGFPSVYQTHNSKFKTPEKTKFFNQFNKFVYIYRNPHDTMISLFYDQVIKKNKSLWESYLIDKKILQDSEIFNEFVKKTLPIYIKHVKENKKHADLILYYDDLMQNRYIFRKLLYFFIDHIDDKIYNEALTMSSFENIRKLETKKRKKEIQKNSIILFKTRDGRSGQYKKVMKKELIDFISKKWKEAGLNERR